MSQETGSGDQLGDTLEGNAQEAGNQAEAAQAAAEIWEVWKVQTPLI